jgi:hypothetical protein
MASEQDTPVDSALQQLEALILQDDDFRRLESSLRPFNIFEALRIAPSSRQQPSEMKPSL